MFFITQNNGVISGPGGGDFVPDNAIECTEEITLNYQDYTIVDGELIKKSTEDIQARLDSIAIDSVKNEALQLLKDSDYRVLQDKFVQYSLNKQTAVLEYREALREVVRGNESLLPAFVYYEVAEK